MRGAWACASNLAGNYDPDCLYAAWGCAAHLWDNPDFGVSDQPGEKHCLPGHDASGDYCFRDWHMDSGQAGDDYYGSSGDCGNSDCDSWFT